MRNRACQFNMPHALAPHLGKCDLDAAFFANHAAVLEAFILAAKALIILDRTENLGAEKPVPLRFKRAVINGLRFLYFAVRPRADFFRGRKADADGIEIFRFAGLLKKVKQVFQGSISSTK